MYVNTNYKHYNATIRRSEKGIQLKNTDHQSKPSVPTLKSSLEPLHQELLATINDKGLIRDQPLPKIPPLSPSVKLLEIQNPPPLDFQHLKVNKNINPLSVTMDMLDEEDRPHTNEVTFSDSQSITNYEI